jgi:VanZ family protein
MRLARALAAIVGAMRAWRALLLLLIAVISYFALSPRPPAAIDFGWDKLNHLAAFAALTVSACLSFPASRASLPVLALALLGYGGLIEVVQLFVPGRSSEWSDLLADSIGIACGLFIATSALWAVAWVKRRGC